MIPNQECALKHKLLVYDLELTLQIPLAKPFNHIRFVWKLHDPDVQFAFCGRIERSFTSYDLRPTNFDTVWENYTPQKSKLPRKSAVGPEGGISIRKLGGGMIVLMYVWVKKDLFKKLGSFRMLLAKCVLDDNENPVLTPGLKAMHV